MKLLFYLFFCVFTLNQITAQYTPVQTSINKKIKEVSKSNDESFREKEFLRLKSESEKLNYKLGILRSGSALMTVYSMQSKNEKVIDIGNQLKKIAIKEKDSTGTISQIYGKNALAFFALGLDDAGLKDLKTAIKYTKEIKNIDKKNYFQGTYYENMTAYYSNSKRYGDKKYRDSVLYFYNKSIESIKKVSDSNKSISKSTKDRGIAFTNMRIAIYYLEEPNVKGNLEKAQKQLLVASEFYNDDNNNASSIERAMLHNQFSWLYMEKKEYQKSIDYANKALALEKQNSFPANRVDSYEILVSDYLGIGDKKMSKFYMDKYTALKDSIAFVDKEAANATIKKTVDKVEKENNESSKKQWLVAGLIIFSALIAAILIWRRKNKILHHKYEQIIQKLKNETLDSAAETTTENNVGEDNEEYTPENPLSVSKNHISTETENRILKKLVAFEKSEKYLKKDLTISMLSAQLGTNNKYLSEIINKNKSRNFSNYINELRINYIVYKLYNEPKYREYKIAYLAQESGFASPQVFVLAFRKINGINPSYFVKNLKNDSTTLLQQD